MEPARAPKALTTQRALAFALALPITVSCATPPPATSGASVQVPNSIDAGPATRVRPYPFRSEASGVEAARVAKMLATNAPLKWNDVPPGRSARYGRAAIVIRASREEVLARVTDFGKYKAFAPNKFKASRVTDKSAEGTNVYLQLPIMNGVVTLWTEALFSPPTRVSDDEEFVEGTLIQGNMKDFHVVWTVRTVPDGASKVTELRCDLLVTPHVPAPEDKVDEELRDAAEQAIVAIRKSAEEGAVHTAGQAGRPSASLRLPQ